MAWKIELDAAAKKQLGKLGHAPAARVVARLQKISQLVDPRARGKAMVDDWSGYWRFRFEDFRVIAKIEDDRLVIFVVAIGHRREVYD